MVECNFWASAARNLYSPFILSAGTIFAAIGLDNQSIRDVTLFDKNIFHSEEKESEKESEKKRKKGA